MKNRSSFHRDSRMSHTSDFQKKDSHELISLRGDPRFYETQFKLLKNVSSKRLKLKKRRKSTQHKFGTEFNRNFLFKKI